MTAGQWAVIVAASVLVAWMAVSLVIQAFHSREQAEMIARVMRGARPPGPAGFASSRVVQVEWLDTFVVTGWHGAGEARAIEPKVYYSVGYLLGVTKDDVRIFMSEGGDGEVGTVKVLPRSTVRAVRVLRGGRREANLSRFEARL